MLLAEFASAEALLEAARRARAAGYQRLEAHTPFAVEGLDQALGIGPGRLPGLMLIFGLIGGISAFLLQIYLAALDYPLNAGGRPYFSWPPFLLLTFEFTVLGAALAGFFGFLGSSGLPRLHHPLFDLPAFERASQDRFFLAIEGSDGEPEAIRRFLEALRPEAVWEVGRGVE